MRIVFLLERPSQFDAPLFRLAAKDPEHAFEAWFTAADAGGPVADPELGRAVDWGFDLAAGYRSEIVPADDRQNWFDEHLRGTDLLIVNGYTRRVYLDATFAARRLGVPRALRIDSVRFPGAPVPGLAKRFLLREILQRRFDRFLATGSLGASYLEACGVEAGRIGRYPYAVDHAAFAAASAGRRAEARARWGIPADARVVLSLTKFSEREAPWDLVEACRLSSSFPSMESLSFVLAGDGLARAELARRVVGLDRVLLPGYVPYPELPALYAAADCFVHPAREERWGVSVAEALACGLPVIASDRVGAGFDLIAPGENGDRYPFGDARALAATIERALALDPVVVAAASAPRLAAFGLESTWRGIVAAAAGVRA